MYSVCSIKNISGEIQQLHEKEFTIDETFIISDDQRYLWANNSDVITAISSGLFQIIGYNGGIENISDQINYLKDLNNPLSSEKRDPTGKLRVHETSRPVGTFTYFTGSGDDPDDPGDVGNGQLFTIDHHQGEEDPEIIYIDFNILDNRTYIHEGYVIWHEALFDTINLSVVTRYPNYIVDSTANTSFELNTTYGLIVPSISGNVIFTENILSPTGGLVYMPLNDEGTRTYSFWNADWNSSTGLFENLTAAPFGNGEYNIFAAEIELSRFINKLPLLGTGFEKLQTADTQEIGHGMRIKLESDTYGDHNWKVSFVATLYRERTTSI